MRYYHLISLIIKIKKKTYVKKKKTIITESIMVVASEEGEWEVTV